MHPIKDFLESMKFGESEISPEKNNQTISNKKSIFHQPSKSEPSTTSTHITSLRITSASLSESFLT